METLFENEFAIVVCVKNESPYIGEFVDYHYRIGVDKFYIYDNDSDDRSELLRALKPWIDRGIVEYLELPERHAQMIAYNDALDKHRFDCKYFCVLDADEFLVPKNNRGLVEIVDAIFKLPPPPPEKFIASVGFNWRMFGSNGQDRKLDGGILERFTRRNPDNHRANAHIKSVMNPRRVDKITVPHCANYYFGNVCINENGLPIPYAFNQQNTVEKIQINHYHTKSREEFIKKVARGNADQEKKRNLKEFDRCQNDIVEDLNALNIFQKPSFHREIYRDDEAAIGDLKFMLAEENPDVELLLTCFHRAHGLKNESQRSKFESESIEKILKLEFMPTYSAQLLIDSLPELLTTSTQHRKKIVGRGIELLQTLEGIMRHSFQFNDQFDFWRRREWLELFK